MSLKDFKIGKGQGMAGIYTWDFTWCENAGGVYISLISYGRVGGDAKVKSGKS